MSRSYRVSFETFEPRGGHFERLRFVITKEGSGEDYPIVKVSGSVETWFLNFGISGDDLGRVAAKAVEQHLLGDVPRSQYREGADTIIVESTWYPGHPEAPETIDDFENFVVTLPPPPLGFKTPTSKT